MKNNRGASVAVAGITLACAFACVLAPMRIAEAMTVTGYDYYLGDSTNNAIDILSVDGAAGEIVYCRVTDNGAVIADHLAYQLGENSGGHSGPNEYTGVVTAVLGKVDPSHSYTIEAYANYDETDLVYSGDIRAVFARLEGVAEPIVIAWRTRGTESREFNAPETISYGSDTFALSSDSPVLDAPLTYAYSTEKSDESVASGSITYVDDAGAVLKTEPIDGIAKGTPKSVSVPEVVATDRGYYRTVYFNKTVQASYPGVRDFTVMCKKVSDALVSQQGFYTAVINLVDQNGTILATDSVSVAGKVHYTVPSTLYKGGSLIDTYALASTQDVRLDDHNVLTLEPTTEGVTDGRKTFNVVYDAKPGESEVTWTVKIVNGTADPKSADRVIGTKTFTVTPENPTATYVPEGQMVIDGQVFVPASGGELSYTWNSGADPLSIVYYVPDGYVPEEAYDITINYVNIANGEVIGSEVHTISPKYLDDQTFVSPENLTVGSNNYVRLDGQETGIRHGYYGPTRTYTVYYRDVNDNLHKDTVISRIRVEYIDGGETYVPGTTTATNEGVADEGATGDGTVVSTSIPDGTDLSTVDGADGSTIVNSDGTDLNTERIDDDVTPLARGIGDNENPLARLVRSEAGLIGLGVGVAAAIGVLVLFLVKRRKGNDDGEDAA